MKTPFIDKARSEYLASDELLDALSELNALNGGGCYCELRIRSRDGWAAVKWNYINDHAGPRFHRSIEEAIVNEADDILRLAAEERAAS